MATFKRVSTKATKFRAAQETEFEVAVSKGKSLTVKQDDVKATRTFAMGDEVYWDFAITVLTGKIVNITENTVSVQGRGGAKVRRFTMAQFAHKNFDFNVKRANEETVDYFLNG